MKLDYQLDGGASARAGAAVRPVTAMAAAAIRAMNLR